MLLCASEIYFASQVGAKLNVSATTVNNTANARIRTPGYLFISGLCAGTEVNMLE